MAESTVYNMDTIYDKKVSDIVGHDIYDPNTHGQNFDIKAYIISLHKYIKLDEINEMDFNSHNHIYNIFYKYFENSKIDDIGILSYNDVNMEGNFGEKIYTDGYHTIKVFDFNILDHCKSFLSGLLIGYDIYKMLKTELLGKYEYFINHLALPKEFHMLTSDKKYNALKKKLKIPLDTNSVYAIYVYDALRPIVIYKNKKIEPQNDKIIDTPYIDSIIEPAIKTMMRSQHKHCRAVINDDRLFVSYRDISFNLFMEYLLTLWVIRLVCNITFLSNGPLSTVIAHRANKYINMNYVMKFNYDEDSKNIQLNMADEKYILMIMNIDHKNVVYNHVIGTYPVSTTNNVIFDYKFLNYKSFCQKFGDGVQSPMNVWDILFKKDRPKISKIIKTLCNNFHEYNNKHFIPAISVKYDVEKHISSFTYNQINYFAILFCIIGSNFKRTLLKTTIDYNELLKYRISKDIDFINKYKHLKYSTHNNVIIGFDSYKYKFVDSRNDDYYIRMTSDNNDIKIYPNGNVNYIIKTYETLGIYSSRLSNDEFIHQLNKYAGDNGYINLIANLSLLSHLLPQFDSNKIIKKINDLDKTIIEYPNNKFLRYNGKKEDEKWSNIPNVIESYVSMIKYNDNFGNGIKNLPGVNGSFLQTIILKRSQWFSIKNSMKFAYHIYNNDSINKMLNAYIKHAFRCLCHMVNTEDGEPIETASWDDVNDNKREFIIKLFLQFSYDFEKPCVIIENIMMGSRNINSIYDYIKGIVYGDSRLRTKVEMMFLFSRLLGYYIGKIYLLYIEKEEKEYNNQNIDSIITKINDKIKLYKLNKNFIESQYGHFLEKVHCLFRIPESEKFKSGKEYLNRMFKDIDRQTWMPLAISYNYNIGCMWNERKIISNKRGTPEYAAIDVNDMNTDDYEFIIKNKLNTKGKFKTRGVDNSLTMGYIPEDNKKKLCDTHPNIYKNVVDYALETISGVSGHTIGIIYSFKLFDTIEGSYDSLNDQKIALLSAFAYMLPRKDHTIMEMVEAIKGFGIDCDNAYKDYRCFESLIPDKYQFENSTFTKDDFLNKIYNKMGARFNTYINHSYYKFVETIYNIIITDHDINDVFKQIEAPNNRKLLEDAGVINVADDKVFFTELYILFCIFRREASILFKKKDGTIDMNKIVNLYDRLTYDLESYGNAQQEYSDFLKDYLIYRYEDEEITPIEDAHYILELNDTFERNCLFFLQHYFKKTHPNETYEIFQTY